jgi:hypothetical protein
MVYLAEKEVMNKGKVFGGFVGYMKQFTATDLNGLKPDMDRTGTSTAYFFRDRHLNVKKNHVFKNYVKRSVPGGRSPSYLNVEELATLWHFPIEGVVKAPLIQKTAGRKAEPPMSLPQDEEMLGEQKMEPLFLGDIDDEDADDGLFILEKKTDNNTSAPSEILEDSLEDAGTVPPNLPFV